MWYEQRQSFAAQVQILFLAAADKMIKIWSAYTGQIIRTLEGHTAGLSDIAWSTDNVYLASASDDTTIRIWNVDMVGS